MQPAREPNLPPVVRMLLDTLHGAGYQAYVVGGCVRDSLLGRTPEDWDICTSARPDETEALFAGRRLLLNGKRHGTVAVVLDGHSWEITTFRQDGAYSDGRHPDAVQFVPSLREDLARRDFTVNAMAWTPDAGLVDPFGGQDDLAAGCCAASGTLIPALPRTRCGCCVPCGLPPSWILHSTRPPPRPPGAVGTACGRYRRSGFLPSWTNCWRPRCGAGVG